MISSQSATEILLRDVVSYRSLGRFPSPTSSRWLSCPPESRASRVSPVARELIRDECMILRDTGVYVKRHRSLRASAVATALKRKPRTCDIAVDVSTSVSTYCRGAGGGRVPSIYFRLTHHQKGEYGANLIYLSRLPGRSPALPPFPSDLFFSVYRSALGGRRGGGEEGFLAARRTPSDSLSLPLPRPPTIPPLFAV